MERAVINSDLKKHEIQPEHLLKGYHSLIEEDIQNLLPGNLLKPSLCPVSNEKDTRDSFFKLGMKYQVSQSLGNIYLSPRPSVEDLKQFYLQSKGRHFWLTELWPKTKNIRAEKIILPQLEWVQGFMDQYGSARSAKIGEFLPNHWGYAEEVERVLPIVDYHLVDPLFNADLGSGFKEIYTSVSLPESCFDAVLLFEALDRTVNPRELLECVKNLLKSGGLCFMTCLLASGFEVQVLGSESGIFVPPERMNLLSLEGMNDLIEKIGGFEVIEFSTPGVLDIPNVISKLNEIKNSSFYDYLFNQRRDQTLVESFQDFLQINCLGTFGRLVLKKK